jgi:citrate synthase
LLHEDLRRFFDGFPRDAHPMPVLSSAVSALSTFYQDSLDPFDPAQVEISTIRLLAKLPTIASYAYKKSIGQPFLYPDNSLGYAENFLRLTFGVPSTPYQVDPVFARVLDTLFVLHADPRAELLDARRCASPARPQANLFTSISAGVNAPVRPAARGAPMRRYLEMLERTSRPKAATVEAVRPPGQEQGGGRHA